MLTLIKDADLEEIKAELSRVMNEAAGRDDVQEFAFTVSMYSDNPISSVHKYIRENIKYTRDPEGLELFIAPWKMIELINKGMERREKIASGDCDDMALFAASLYKALGYRSRIVLLDTGGAGIDHAIAEVYSDEVSAWIMVDPASENPLGWTPKYYARMDVA